MLRGVSRIWLLSLCLYFVPFAAPAYDSEESLPLWEYGLGLGYVRFWHYPASDQTKDWYLPVPTFQYRGEILRADDREGTKAYLLRQKDWTLEIGGGGLPSIKSEENNARRGMEDLPWGFQLGPQLVYRHHPEFQVRLGFYQAMISTDWKYARGNGLLSELKFVWKVSRLLQESGLFPTSRVRGQVGLSFDSASKEFLETYYSVPREYALPDRREYEAREGFLSATLSYFQGITYRKHGIYFGAAHSMYHYSVNRESPLHRSDSNLSLFAGITYTLGESERRAIPEDQAEGAIDKIRERWPFRFRRGETQTPQQEF